VDGDSDVWLAAVDAAALAAGMSQGLSVSCRRDYGHVGLWTSIRAGGNACVPCVVLN
jgi:hypothetical protein